LETVPFQSSNAREFFLQSLQKQIRRAVAPAGYQFSCRLSVERI
jgi:hypothetical protein